MTTDMERATRVFGLTHGADLPHVVREFEKARDEERARVLDEVSDDMVLASIMRRLLGGGLDEHLEEGQPASALSLPGRIWISDAERSAIERVLSP